MNDIPITRPICEKTISVKNRVRKIGSKYSCLLFKLNEHLKIDGERSWMDLKVRSIKSFVCL